MSLKCRARVVTVQPARAMMEEARDHAYLPGLRLPLPHRAIARHGRRLSDCHHRTHNPYLEDDDSDYPASGRGDDWDDDEDEFDCGWVRGVGCQLAGTEECDFECPFRDENYRGLRLTQARIAKRKEA
jgi:hypothetical protein